MSVSQLLEIVHYFTVSMTLLLKMYNNFVLANWSLFRNGLKWSLMDHYLSSELCTYLQWISCGETWNRAQYVHWIMPSLIGDYLTALGQVWNKRMHVTFWNDFNNNFSSWLHSNTMHRFWHYITPTQVIFKPWGCTCYSLSRWKIDCGNSQTHCIH